jgi:excisionase family DNA binding protein
MHAMTTATAPEGTALLKPAEAAEQLRVSRSTIYRLIETGQLPSVHVGERRAVRIPREAIAAYIRANTAERQAAS